MLVIWVLMFVTFVTFTGGGGGAAGSTTTAGATLAAWIASADFTGTAAGSGTTGVPLLADTVAETVEGATAVTVTPLETTVVGLTVVVAAAAEDCGVLRTLAVARDGAPGELGLEAADGADNPAVALTPPLTPAPVGLGAAGEEAEDADRAFGVVVSLWVTGGWVVAGACVVGGAVAVGVSAGGAPAVTVALAVAATVDGSAGTVKVGAPPGCESLTGGPSP